MANVYKSRYTGEQIEQLLGKADDIQTITAFPDTQDEDYLGAIEIDNRPYLIPKGTAVKANEGAREGGYLYTLEIGADKFLLPKYVEAINAASAGSGTPLKKLTIGDTLYEIPQGVEVKANDGAVEGGYLRTLTIGNDKFLLPDYITPNPAADATQTLTKIAIGNVIYELPETPEWDGSIEVV